MSVQQKTVDGWKRCDGIQLNNYSTNEQLIGTWIDGKPLYRKVILAPNPGITTQGQEYTIATIDDDIEVLFMRCTFKNISSGRVYNLPYTGSGTTATTTILCDKDKILIHTNNDTWSNTAFSTFTIVIEYTKVGD